MIRTFCVIKFLVILFISGSVFAVELDGNVISIGQSESLWLSKLGKPISIDLDEPDEMFGMNRTKSLKYKGANLDFHLGSNGFYLWRLKLTSSDLSYLHNKVRVGAKANEISSALGEPSSKEIGDKAIVWFYHTKGFDGWVRIELINNVVVSIFATEDWS